MTGADLDELEDLLVRYRPKLIYTNPTFQNPTGTTMPRHVRRDLLTLAERYRVPIVEDATYGELYFSDPPPPSLRDLDTNNIVILLSSFSKVMAPGLRLGWLSAARSIVDQIALIKQRMDPHTQNLAQLAVARLIRDGSFDEHLRAIRAEHARRCAQMIAAIQRHVPAGALRFTRPQGGLYLWCRLAPGVDSTSLLERALASGVAFLAGPAFYPDPAGASELRLCFSSVLPGEIDAAISRLAGCLQAGTNVAALGCRLLRAATFVVGMTTPKANCQLPEFRTPKGLRNQFGSSGFGRWPLVVGS